MTIHRRRCRKSIALGARQGPVCESVRERNKQIDGEKERGRRRKSERPICEPVVLRLLSGPPAMNQKEKKRRMSSCVVRRRRGDVLITVAP